MALAPIGETSSSKNQKFHRAWDLRLQFLKGVGEKLAQRFAKSDIHNLWDLLLFLPKTYEDRRRALSFQEMLAAAGKGQSIAGRGVIDRYLTMPGQGGFRKSKVEAVVYVFGENSSTERMGEGQFGRILFTWFHGMGAHVEKRFPVGSKIVFQGKVQEFRGALQMVHPEISLLSDTPEPWEFGSFVPVYAEIGGIGTRITRKVLALALERPEVKNLPESLPSSLCQRLSLPGLAESLRELHFPKTWQPPVEHNHPQGPYFKRVVFEELFMMSLALHLRRAEWKKLELSRGAVPNFSAAFPLLEPLRQSLPFRLTQGQERVLSELMNDMGAAGTLDMPMHRLLQGDVGSGKTIVAFMAAMAAIQAGYQVAFMAPTEILADQHFQNFTKLFPEHSSLSLLLKGALTAAQKRNARARISSGEARLIIGTQALLTEDTHFERLGLVIVDEQHRFGVEQRLSLKQVSEGPKGLLVPHLLVMTATPIPRSLALTLYGDLSLSILKEKPAGRQPIKTHIVKEGSREKLAARLGDFLREGRQVYVVYPLVEESEDLDLKDAVQAHKDWQKQFPNFEIGLLHGKMKPKEKEAAFMRFRSGETRMLVSTTVIEVGVDVPNASVMVIEHAERFGLSQLHQLRGRVGRGSVESLCILVGPNHLGPISGERLRTMEQSDDGFLIAEKDLELRGPGEFLGRKQSGLPGFRVAHVLRDVEILDHARLEARALLERDPRLESVENQGLKTMLQKWWGDRLELTLSG